MNRLHVSSNKPIDGFGSFLPSFMSDGKREVALNRVKYAPVFCYSDLEELIAEPVALVKIDVEGWELEVIRGMTAIGTGPAWSL